MYWILHENTQVYGNTISLYCNLLFLIYFLLWTYTFWITCNSIQCDIFATVVKDSVVTFTKSLHLDQEISSWKDIQTMNL